MHLFNDWGAKLTQSNMSKKFGLKGSPTYMTLPFTDNAARRTVLATCKNDPKMSTMCDNIQEIMGEDQQIMMDTAALQKVDTETLQGKPKDHLRKVIVTTQNCFTAMTAFDTSFFHAMLSQKERDVITESFQDEVDKDGNFAHQKRPRILSFKNQTEGLEFEGIVTDRLKKRAMLLEAADKAGLWLIPDDSDEGESDSEYVPDD
ncbi:hypothetical protein J4E91_001019 [Alternaria rosae]|nr:hypothetical protein J4E91_001019 [Alternaria rosae]